MKTILTLNRVGFLGGVERVVVSCGQAVRLRDFHPLIVCPLPGELASEAERRGLEVVFLNIDRSRATRSPIMWMRLFGALRRGQRQVKELARTRGVHLVHTHHPIGALYALHAVRTLGLPLLLHVHETLPAHRFYRAVARHVIPYCAAIVCVSERSRDLMLTLGASPDRLRVIYNGVDPSFLEPAVSVPELAGPGPHVGVFGVLEPRKGQDLFIQASRTILEKHRSAQFWIVGEMSFAENASYVASLQDAIAAAGLSERMRLAGHRRNVRDWMARMDVIVVASRALEALPTVLIEGALLGRPLVTTEVGGVREIIDDGRTGLVVPPGDVQALAAAIGRALGREGPLFGAAAQADALQRFTFDRFGDEMAALYQSLVPDEAAVSA